MALLLRRVLVMRLKAPLVCRMPPACLVVRTMMQQLIRLAT